MRNQLRAGFSLMEMAIVLVIMGLIAAAAMPSILRYRLQVAIRETKERQEFVIQAVAAYVAARGELPAAAPPGGDGRSQHGLAVGIVPYHTLGLRKPQTKDAFGHYMTYAVPVIQGDLPNLDGDNRLCRSEPQQPLTLKEQGQVLYGPGVGNDYVALILVSHGPGGEGAFTGTGSERIPGPDMTPEEQENAASTPVFNDGAYGMVVSAHPFRHLVKWVTRMNLLGVYAKQPCHEPPRRDVPRAGNSPAGGAPGGAGLDDHPGQWEDPLNIR